MTAQTFPVQAARSGVDDYFAQLRAAYVRAVEHAGSTSERDYQVAGNCIRLRFAGDALVPCITPALAHLAIPPATAELQVLLFDSTSTQTPFPFPSTEVQAQYDRGQVWTYQDETHQLVIDPYSKTATLYDQPQNTVFFWSPSADGFSYHETSFPLRLVWRWWLQPKGLQLTHAASVADEHGAVLIAGPGGMGKSTTALACLNQGLAYLGDDFVLVRAEPVPHVYSLYCSAKVSTDHFRNFAPLENRVINPGRNPADKAMLMLDAQYGDVLCMDAPVRALFVPHIRGGGHTQLAPISPMAALRQLAVGTVFVTLNANQAEMNLFGRLVQALPCYQLELGTDLAEIPVVIRDYLGSVT